MNATEKRQLRKARKRIKRLRKEVADLRCALACHDSQMQGLGERILGLDADVASLKKAIFGRIMLS